MKNPLIAQGVSASHPSESNRRPADYESAALPTELGWRGGALAGINEGQGKVNRGVRPELPVALAARVPPGRVHVSDGCYRSRRRT